MGDNNMDDIENDDPNTFGNNIYGLQTNFINAKDDEGEEKDDCNTTLVEWCSKNNIKYLQGHMNIDKVTLNDIVVNNNVNEDF